MKINFKALLHGSPTWYEALASERESTSSEPTSSEPIRKSKPKKTKGGIRKKVKKLSKSFTEFYEREGVFDVDLGYGIKPTRKSTPKQKQGLKEKYKKVTSASKNIGEAMEHQLLGDQQSPPPRKDQKEKDIFGF